MGRAPCCDKTTVKRGPWSPEEDAKLKSYIQENGTGGNWIALPHKIGLKRCGKSCRLRWLNYLRPNIKHGSFSEDEDYIICTLYLNIGSRWSIIASQLPGRTDNDIKNYWNTKLKKKLMGMQRKGHQLSKVKQEMKGEILGDLKSQPLSKSMNLYESSYWPIEFPLILTNPSHLGQEHHVKTEIPTFNHYPFNTISSQPELLDQSSKKHTQIISNTPYFDIGDAMNLVPEFNTYPFEINEHNYINAQLEHFDGLVCGFDNVFNRSNCTSSSAQSSTSWGDPLAYPHPQMYHQICPPEQISPFQ